MGGAGLFCPFTLWMGLGDEGLYLKTGPDIFFRLFHPPLFIPWGDLGIRAEEGFLGQPMLRVVLSRDPRFKLWLPKAVLAGFGQALAD